MEYTEEQIIDMEEMILSIIAVGQKMISSAPTRFIYLIQFKEPVKLQIQSVIIMKSLLNFCMKINLLKKIILPESSK